MKSPNEVKQDIMEEFDGKFPHLQGYNVHDVPFIANGLVKDFLSQSLDSLQASIVESLPPERAVCGCTEDPDPMAPGYHTKNCDLEPYGYNAYRKEILDLLK
jgi:hypothetical protein